MSNTGITYKKHSCKYYVNMI